MELAFALRGDGQVVDDTADALGLPRNDTGLRSAGRRDNRALERHDVIAGVDVDVAVLQRVFVDEPRTHPRGDPPVGHDLARFADTVLGLGPDDLRAFDDAV